MPRRSGQHCWALSIPELSDKAPTEGITIGILLASCVDYATQNRMDTGSYRIPIAIQVGSDSTFLLRLLS